MKYICHRGNMNGPYPSMENKPEYIQIALDAGYDVEVDVWLQPDGLYLGHDAPIYKTSRQFLQNQRLWVHCKNNAAYLELSKYSDINCFFQDNDDLTITTRGYLWSHSKNTEWNSNTVIVRLELSKMPEEKVPFAICSDYIGPDAVKYEPPFDLLIVDIDGVMTDGTKMYDRDGKVFGKTYCDLDFTAIKRFMAAGVKVCFLSGDQTVNKTMAESRKIKFFYNPPGTDKVDILPTIKDYYHPKQIVYIGDDYYDITIMKAVDLAFCPQTSPKAVKQVATVLDVPAGKGVLAKLYDMFDEQIAYAFPMDFADVNPK